MMPAFLLLALTACDFTGSIGKSVFVDDDNDGFEAEFDCDDGDPLAYPGFAETCDGRDNDCNGAVDDRRVCSREEAFIQTTTLDLLFVVDTSVNMDSHQAAVANSLEDLLPWVTGPDANSHIGAITMDMVDPLESGRLQGTAANRWIDAGSSYQEVNAWADTAVIAGSDGDGAERGLDALMAALTTDLTHNEGFRRPSAHLVVLMLSSESDQSTTDVDSVLDGLPNATTIHAIVPVGEPDCGDEFLSGRHVDLAAITGGTYLSICELDYGPFLSALGQSARVQGLADEFPLVDVVRPGTLEVEVTYPGGRIDVLDDDQVSLSPNNQALILRDTPPPAGSRLLVRYEADR